MNTSEVCRDALADLAEREPDERCMAVHAIAVLDSLGFDDREVSGEAGREKLAGRPCGKVREFAEYAKAQRMEARRHLLTLFAKRVKPVGVAP